jgi:anti-sigma factor RsiW
MHDLSRDELQDLLPELLHGRLSATDAAALERAVAADPELAAELSLLRSVRATQRPAPVIDIARIVAALPSPPALQVAPLVDDLAARRATKRPVISRTFARAAALLIVVGGGTMVSVWEGRSTASTPVASVVPAESLAAAGNSPQLGLGASTDDLTVEQLRALEADIRALDGVPSADPDGAAELLPVEGA